MKNSVKRWSKLETNGFSFSESDVKVGIDENNKAFPYVVGYSADKSEICFIAERITKYASAGDAPLGSTPHRGTVAAFRCKNAADTSVEKYQNAAKKFMMGISLKK